MKQAWSSTIVFLAASLCAAVAGCESGLSSALEGKECGPQGECLPGYECDPVSNECIQSSGTTGTQPTTSAGGSGGDGGATTAGGEAGTAGSGGVLNTSGSTTGGGGAGAGCPGGQTECGAAGCVDAQADPGHCGGCDVVCGAPISGDGTGTPACEAGVCGVSCTGATPDECDVQGTWACVDKAKDSQHCGACGAECSAGAKCSSGACAPSCAPGLTNCGGACVNLKTDPGHCGNCATSCTTGLGGLPACSNGACQGGCAAGLGACPVGILGKKACTNTLHDPENCGACGTACGDGQLCVNGQCVSFVYAGACWECEGATPKCCTVAGETVCAAGDACPP